jgi:hypothetical protein
MKKSTLLILAAFFFITACEKVIDLNVPDGPVQLVVDAWYTDEDTLQYVKLSTTAPYFEDAETPRVSNATVTLHTYENGVLENSETLFEDPFNPGVYPFTAPAVLGKGYQLEINAPDLAWVKSDIQIVKPVPPILALAWAETDPDFEDESLTYEVLVFTYETPGLGDYYRWFSWVNGEYQNKPENINITNDDLVDGSDIPGLDVTNQLYRLGDTVRISQATINESAYDFLSLLISQTAFIGSPFDTPPAPIIGNMKAVNGNDNALGFFGVSATSIDEIVIGS